MSVIRYGRDEMIDAIAACWDRGSIAGTESGRWLDYLAQQGQATLAANTDAYNATYSDCAEPELDITRDSIRNAIVSQTIERKLRGFRCLSGLRYNLIANNGKDFATVEILDFLLTLTVSRLESLDRRRAA